MDGTSEWNGFIFKPPDPLRRKKVRLHNSAPVFCNRLTDETSKGCTSHTEHGPHHECVVF